MDNKSNIFVTIIETVAIVGILSFLFIAQDNPNSPNNVTNQLEKNGFTSVKVGDAIPCHNKRTLGSKFTAVNAQGEKVIGQICADKIETTQNI